MAVTRYVEANYVEAGYYEVIVEPNVYVVPGYVAAGYATGAEYQTAFSLTADLTEVTATEASATISSQFSVSANGGIAGELDALTLNSSFDSTTNAIKTVDAQADFGALFSPTFVIGAVKHIDATLSTAISMSATVSKLTGNEATLSNIISLSLQGIKQVDANATPSASFTQTASAVTTTDTSAQLSSTFTVTANTSGLFDLSVNGSPLVLSSAFSVSITPRVLVRDTSFEIINSTYVNFDTDSVFGSHGLKFTGNVGNYDNIQSNIIYAGSTWYGFNEGSTFTSTNGTSWTKTSNNISSLPSRPRIQYLDNKFVYRENDAIYYSTNGTTWSSVDLNSSTSFSNNRFNHGDSIAYDGTYWYAGFVSSGANRIYLYRSSTLQGNQQTNWSLYNEYVASSNNNQASIRDWVINGTNIAWAYQTYDTGSNDYRVGVQYGTTFSFLGESDYYWVNTYGPNIFYLNNQWVGVLRDNSAGNVKYSTSSNGTSWSTTSGSSRNQIFGLQYIDSKYFIIDNQGYYTATSLGGSETTLTHPGYTIGEAVSNDWNKNNIGGGILLTNLNNGSIIKYEPTSATNPTKYTDSNFEQVPGLYISRGDNTDFSDWQTIDYRYKPSSSNSFFRIEQYNGGVTNWGLYHAYNQMAVIDSNGTTYSGTTHWNQGAYNHIRIIKSGGKITVWLNGNRSNIHNTTFSTSSSSQPVILRSQSTNNANLVDELLISDDALSSHSDTTITVPTAAYENGTNTDLLVHFDNDLTDDSRFSSTVDPEATLNVVSSVVANTGGSFFGAANITASASVSADVEKLVETSSNLSSQFSAQATVTRIHPLSSSFNVQADILATVSKTAVFDSSQNSTFTTTIDGNAVRDADCDFDAIATQLTAVSKIGDFLINADVTASLTATAIATASAQATLESAVSLSVSETLFKSYEATLQTTATVNCVNNVVVDPAASLSSAFTQTTAGDRIRFGTSSLSSVANLVVETNPIKNANATLTSSFNQPSMDFVRIRPFAGSVTAEATLTADGIKTVNPSIGTIQSAITTSIDGNAVRDAVGDFDAIATQLTAAAKIGDFLIDADVVSTITCNAVKKTGNIIDLVSTATVTANYGIIKQFASTQTSSFTVVAEGTTNLLGAADLDSTTAVTVDAVKAVEAEANLTGTGGFNVTAVATRNNEIIMSSAFTQSTVGKRIRFGVTSAASAVTVQITAGKLVSVGSTINTVATVVASVRVINIDDIVYTIPAETREFSIVSEDREHDITQENREYTLT